MRTSIVLFAGLLAFAATRPVTATAQEPEFVMEVGTVAPSGSPWAAQLKDFKKRVQEGSNGRIKVKLRLGRGNERSLARRTQMGSMQAFAGSVGGMSSIIREVNVIEAPFLFPDHKTADRVLDDPNVLKQMKKILNKRGLVFGSWSENGYRSYFSRKKIRSAADMKGEKFRSQESMVHIETYKALGASPVAVDVANTLMSVKTGVVDGFDNTPLFAMAGAWYQGLQNGEQHIFLSRHCYQPALISYSKKWFDKLPKDLQKMLTSLPHQLTVDGRQQVRKVEPVLLKNLKRYGYDIYEPTDKELAPFKAAQKGVADKVAKKMGPDAVKLLKAIRKAM